MLGWFLIAIATPVSEAKLLPGAGIVVSEDDYPPDALIAGIEGVASAELAIAADGVPTGCRVTVTASNSSLDAATCRVLLRTRFKAARDGDNRPVASVILKRVHWKIERENVDPFVDGTAITHVAIDGAGQLRDCTVTMKGLVASRLPANYCPLLGDAGRGAPALAKLLGHDLSGATSAEVRVTLVTGPPHSLIGSAPGQVFASAAFDVSTDGKIADCKVDTSRPLFGENLALCDLVRNRLNFVEASASRHARLAIEVYEERTSSAVPSR